MKKRSVGSGYFFAAAAPPLASNSKTAATAILKILFISLIKAYLRNAFAACLRLKIFYLFKAEHTRNNVFREAPYARIIGLCGVVIILAGNGNTVFRAFKLNLQRLVIFVCFKVGVSLGYGVYPN